MQVRPGSANVERFILVGEFRGQEMLDHINASGLVSNFVLESAQSILQRFRNFARIASVWVSSIGLVISRRAAAVARSSEPHNWKHGCSAEREGGLQVSYEKFGLPGSSVHLEKAMIGFFGNALEGGGGR